MTTRMKGVHFQTGELVEIQIHEGKITGITILDEAKDQRTPIICPGFIDLQVNGFAGHNLNDRELKVETVIHMIHKLASFGTTSCMPTVITADYDQIYHIMNTINKACAMDSVVHKSIAGIHLEGPYISAEPGFCGAHPTRCMKDPDVKEFMEWQNASGGRIRKVTLAPERAGAMPFIKELCNQGIVAAIGHSCANTAHIQQSIQTGVQMATHLGNGIHYRMDRHAPYLWDLLAHPDVYAGFIADGHHLTRSFVEVLVKVKRQKAIMVSDAVHLAGMRPGKYQTHVGGEVVLSSSGRLHLAENPNILAGSASSLWDGLKTMVDWFPGTLPEIIHMATANPASLLKLTHKGVLKPGADADIVVLAPNPDTGSVTLHQVYHQGKEIEGNGYNE